ncbi:leucine-rich repeat-containing protein kinase family protein [Caulobacter sp. DWR2-3-1b2]|uniref:leucine-rich repeat-containing protein kinase family protein n=1 Tax=unclassified Caulobacter TaxID=2648921 RepID=UPI003CFB7994
MTATLTALRDGSLAGARTLTLRCGLTEFPPEIFGLADTLEVLDLGGNALTALPDDIGRLKALRVLFCSGNHFDRLPPGLGDCPALSQLGFRATGLRDIPAESLPASLRWLTLTDNRIEVLPATLGERPALQKLMLSGNRLRGLPASLEGADKLELLRLSANRLDALPAWLTALPRLAWLAWAGNPLDRHAAGAAPLADWATLRAGRLLGEGASGQVHEAVWTPPGHQARSVALKLFKGAMTSDGLPEREMAACLTAGEHPHLTGALAGLVGHPDGVQGLLMDLLPAQWRVLAGPPSAESCSRDVYDPTLGLDLDVALRIARGIAAGATHLHDKGLTHGDLYAHNILWDGLTGQAVLSDFGAASFLPVNADGGFKRLEVRAWGLLLGELLERCDLEASPQDALWTLQRACVQPDVAARPSMATLLDALNTL